MDYNEFLGQVSNMLETQTERIEQKLDQKIEQKLQEQTERIEQKFEQRFQEQNEKIDGLQEQSKELKLYIENNVSKKIEALFDGYKLAHEKQWE